MLNSANTKIKYTTLKSPSTDVHLTVKGEKKRKPKPSLEEVILLLNLRE